MARRAGRRIGMVVIALALGLPGAGEASIRRGG